MMKTKKVLIAAAILTAIGAPLGLLAATGELTGNREAAAMGLTPPVQVDVAPVLLKRVQRWDEFNGRISAVGSVEIRPRVSGYVTHVAYKEGDEVRRDDLLFTIDPRPYEAALNSATAQLQRARATALLAKGRDERARRLLPSSAVSQDEADARHASYAQSEADVLNAEAAVDLAQLNLEFTQVRAPIDGRAGRALLTVGNLAVADQTLLTSMVSQDPVYVDFDPDEQSYLRYRADARRSPGEALAVRVALAGDEEIRTRRDGRFSGQPGRSGDWKHSHAGKAAQPQSRIHTGSVRAREGIVRQRSRGCPDRRQGRADRSGPQVCLRPRPPTTPRNEGIFNPAARAMGFV